MRPSKGDSENLDYEIEEGGQWDGDEDEDEEIVVVMAVAMRMRNALAQLMTGDAQAAERYVQRRSAEVDVVVQMTSSDFLSRLSLLCSSRSLHGPRQMLHTEKGRPFLLMRINGRS